MHSPSRLAAGSIPSALERERERERGGGRDDRRGFSRRNHGHGMKGVCRLLFVAVFNLGTVPALDWQYHAFSSSCCPSGANIDSSPGMPPSVRDISMMHGHKRK